MTDHLTILTRLADMLSNDEGTLRLMADTPDYQGALGVSERLREIADRLRAVRHPIEVSIETERLRAAQPPVDPRRGDVFGAYPSKYSPPNVQTADDGKLRTWHWAIDAATMYEHLEDPQWRADTWAAVLLRTRYLVTDCGEDATDPVAVNLCLDVVRAATGLKLVPPN